MSAVLRRLSALAAPAGKVTQVTVIKDYLAGKATAGQVKAEIARQRQGMVKQQPPFKQPDLADQKWTPPSIFEEVTIALATHKISPEEADELLA